MRQSKSQEQSLVKLAPSLTFGPRLCRSGTCESRPQRRGKEWECTEVPLSRRPPSPSVPDCAGVVLVKEGFQHWDAQASKGRGSALTLWRLLAPESLLPQT